MLYVESITMLLCIKIKYRKKTNSSDQERVVGIRVLQFCELSRHYSKTYHFGTVPVDPDDDAGNDKSSATRKKKKMVLFAKKLNKKTYGNVCLLCLQTTLNEPNAPLGAWRAALCNVKENSSDADKHLCTV